MIDTVEIGKRVRIYSDPITEKDGEGWAIIKRDLQFDMPTQEAKGFKLVFVEVEFEDDKTTKVRKIKVKC